LDDNDAVAYSVGFAFNTLLDALPLQAVYAAAPSFVRISPGGIRSRRAAKGKLLVVRIHGMNGMSGIERLSDL